MRLICAWPMHEWEWSFPTVISFIIENYVPYKRKKKGRYLLFVMPFENYWFFFSLWQTKKTRSKPSVKMTQFGSSSNRASCIQHHSLGCCWPTHSLPRHWLHSSYQFMDLNELLLLRNSWSCSSAVEPTSMWAPSYGCNVGSCCWLQGCSFCSLPKSLCFLLLLH